MEYQPTIKEKREMDEIHGLTRNLFTGIRLGKADGTNIAKNVDSDTLDSIMDLIFMALSTDREYKIIDYKNIGKFVDTAVKRYAKLAEVYLE